MRNSYDNVARCLARLINADQFEADAAVVACNTGVLDAKDVNNVSCNVENGQCC